MRNAKQDLPGALDKDILIGRLCDEKKELQKRVRALEQANKKLAAELADRAEAVTMLEGEINGLREAMRNLRPGG